MEREYITHLRSDSGIDLTITAIPDYWDEDPPMLADLPEDAQRHIVGFVLHRVLRGAEYELRLAEDVGELLAELLRPTSNLGAVVELASDAVTSDVVILEQSAPSGHALTAVAGAGGAVLVAVQGQDPVLVAWGLGALVIVRVVDPVLTALGEVLATQVRRRSLPVGPREAEREELNRLHQKRRTLEGAIDAEQRSVQKRARPSHVLDEFISELREVEREIGRLESGGGTGDPPDA